MDKEEEEEEKSSSRPHTQSSRYGIPSLPSKIDHIEIWILQSEVVLFGSTSMSNENYGKALSLYNTYSHSTTSNPHLHTYYITAYHTLLTHKRSVLRVDRKVIPSSSSSTRKQKISVADILTEDEKTYTDEEIDTLKKSIPESEIGRKISACGLIGFVRFTGTFYLVVVRSKTLLGHVAGHRIYAPKTTETIRISGPSKSQSSGWFNALWQQKTPSEIAEERYLSIFQLVDMTKDFYFSYSYDLTHTLQHNLLAAAADRVANIVPENEMLEHVRSMYAWNYFLYKEFARRVSRHSKWIVYLCHGFFQQQRCMMSGSAVSLSLIARRSRHFAGTSFYFSLSLYNHKKTRQKNRNAVPEKRCE